jgi:LytS/YehU family sensor histidine kinase
MNNQQARDVVVQFSDLLRYNLYEADVDRIALEKEADYLKNYVALEKARTNDNVKVTLEVNYQHSDLQVAPLIFISFVENAFKYVSGRDDSSNFIQIALNEADGRIDFECRNTHDETDLFAPGIGLNNAARRLELLYKNQYELQIGKENGIYQIHLTLIT